MLWTFEQFRNPDNRYRPVPLWFWNGDLDEAEIERQIGEMKRQGLGGFLIHPRQGLKVPYLSERWFDLVRLAVETAARCGMDVWLYDEYPYPSGIAGGEVLLHHPEAVHRVLQYRETTALGPSEVRMDLPWGRVLSAIAVPETDDGEARWEERRNIESAVGIVQAQQVYQESGLTTYNKKRFFSYRPEKRLTWQAPSGRWKIAVVLEEELQDFKYYGSFVDPCSRPAMKTFIRLTHERYEREIGAYFGTTVKGVFTDEIGILGKLPWSPHIAGRLETQFGPHWRERLPELYMRRSEAPAFRYAYYEALNQTIRSSYYEQVSQWCELRGLQLIAEVPNMRMAMQRSCHIPAGDYGHEKIGRPLSWLLDTYTGNLRKNPKMMSSLARQLGRDRSLIEAFHSIGWSLSLQDMKWTTDRMAAMGINMFSFHAFYYTMDGLAKHDAAPSQFDQNPYWRAYRSFTDYCARMSALVSEGDADIRIAVVDPVTSLWTRLGNPQEGFQYGGLDPREEAELRRIHDDWTYIGKSLLEGQLDYDHLDPELLVEAQIEDGLLRLGHACYSVLVLPPMTNLESGAWERIKCFLEQGGCVLSLGLLPSEPIDSVESDDGAAWEAAQWFGLGSESCGREEHYWSGLEVGELRAHTAASVYAPASVSSKTVERVLEENLSLTEEETDACWVKGLYNAWHLPGRGSLRGSGASRALMRKLREVVRPKGRLVAEPSVTQSFLLHVRTLPDGSVLALATNQNGAEASCEVRLEGGLPDWEANRLWPETGQSDPVRTAYDQREGVHVWTHCFAPYESLLVRLSPPKKASEADSAVAARAATAASETSEHAPAPAGDPGPGEIGPVQGMRAEQACQAKAGRRTETGPADPTAYRLELDRDNALRIADFRFSWRMRPEDEWIGPERIAVKPIDNLLAEWSERGCPHPLPVAMGQELFGTPVRIRLAYPLYCRYEMEFEVDVLPSRCLLMMDEGAIAGPWRIALNGRRLERGDFWLHRVYDPANRAADVADVLLPGTNRLTVEVTAEKYGDGVIEPLYLLGDFGVKPAGRLHSAVLGPLPGYAEIAPWGFAGLPYYAGDIVLRARMDEERTTSFWHGQIRRLELPPFLKRYDTVEAVLNGRSLGIRSWTPYEWSVPDLAAGEAERDGETESAREIEFRIAQSLIGLVEGQYFHSATHTMRTIGEDDEDESVEDGRADPAG